MKNIERISVGQLFMMFYISRMVGNVTYSSYNSDIHDLRYGAVASVIALFLTLLMLIPVHIMIKSGNGKNIIDNSYSILKKFGVVITVIYGLYFLWILINTISFFDVMVANVLNPKTSVFVLTVCVVIASMYGAYKGIEALGRASAIFFIFIAVAVIILICTLIPKSDWLNIEPVLMENSAGIMQITINSIAKDSCIPAMAVLLPIVKGNTKKGSVIWAFGVYISMIILILLIVAVLGDYLDTQIFPVYTVTAIASLGVTKRLDGIFLGVWTAGMFVKISLFIYLFSACIKKFFGEKASRWSILICGIGVVAVSTLISETKGLFNLLFNNYILLFVTLITAVIIPLIITTINKIKKSDI